MRAVWVAALALGGCSALDTLDRIVADPSQAISLHAEVSVSEVARSLDCRAPDNITRATLLKDRRAVADWQMARGVRLLGNEAIAESAHALIDLGQRPSGGYGLAITRKAVLHEDGRLFMRGTFVEPGPNAAVSQALTSPCVLVRLPAANIQWLRVYDQDKRLRAASSQPDGVEENPLWPF